MKKKAFILSICLSLAIVSANAATIEVVRDGKTFPVSMKAVKEQKNQKVAETKKEFEATMKKQRELLYSNLELTKVQKEKAEALHNKAKAKGEPLIEYAKAQKAKLQELKLQKAAEEEIVKQKAIVKAAKKDVISHMKSSQKEFEAILTKEQLAKLEVIKEAKKAEMKEFKKCKCNGHKKPEANDGNPQGQPEDVEKSAPSIGPFPPKCPCEI